MTFCFTESDMIADASSGSARCRRLGLLSGEDGTTSAHQSVHILRLDLKLETIIDRLCLDLRILVTLSYSRSVF